MLLFVIVIVIRVIDISFTDKHNNYFKKKSTINFSACISINTVKHAMIMLRISALNLPAIILLSHHD